MILLPSLLKQDSIHVWSVVLRAPVALERILEKTLSDQENLRRQCLVHSTLRRRFTLSHGILRVLLGRYLDIPPAKIAFDYRNAGKPFVEGDAARIQFNMSHSDDLAVYAFGSNCRLGVDIERIRSMPDLKGIAKLYFNKQEYAELLSLRGAEQTEGFFRCWTRKEAYIKAVGQGFLLPLESFQVSLRTEQPATLRSLPPGDSCQSWKIGDIAQPGYVGAVVFDSEHHSIEYKTPCAAEDLAG